MTAANQSQFCYSADVRMELRVNGHTLAIGQLGPDFVILDDPTDHPPAEAEISLSIDGHVKQWPVHLPDGVTAGKPETRIAPPVQIPAPAKANP
jgi:hypothetical protein